MYHNNEQKRNAVVTLFSSVIQKYYEKHNPNVIKKRYCNKSISYVIAT